MNREDPPQRSIPSGEHLENTGVRFSPMDVERQEVVGLSDKHGVPGVDVRVVPLELADLDLVPRDLARRSTALPLLVKDDAIFVAMSDPSNAQTIKELEFVSGRRVYPFAADAEAIREVIDRVYDLRARGDTHYTPERPSMLPPPPQGTRPSTPGMRAVGAGPSVIPPTAPFPARRARMGTLLDPAPPPAGTRPPGRAPSPPALTPAVSTAIAPLSPPVRQRPPTLAPPTRRALVIDADPSARLLLRTTLAAMGLGVTEATTSAQALVAASTGAYALVVLDPALPDEHGFDLLRRMREHPNLALVPVVVASTAFRGWRAARDLESVFAVRAVIDKPMSPAEVTVRVSEAFTPPGGSLEEVLPAEAEEAMRQSNEAWQRGDLQEAVAQLDRAVAAAPDSYRLRYHLGLTLGRRGEVFQAIQEIERSVAMNERFFPALKNLAVLYERAGFRHKALEAWERACSLSPDEATRDTIKERVLALL